MVAGLIYLLWRNELWALSFMIGQWVHAFTDVCDSLGVMLAFPFSTHIYSIGLWPYAAEAGRLGDAAAYFSGPRSSGTPSGSSQRSRVGASSRERTSAK